MSQVLNSNPSDPLLNCSPLRLPDPTAWYLQNLWENTIPQSRVLSIQIKVKRIDQCTKKKKKGHKLDDPIISDTSQQHVNLNL